MKLLKLGKIDLLTTGVRFCLDPGLSVRISECCFICTQIVHPVQILKLGSSLLTTGSKCFFIRIVYPDQDFKDVRATYSREHGLVSIRIVYPGQILKMGEKKNDTLAAGGQVYFDSDYLSELKFQVEEQLNLG